MFLFLDTETGGIGCDQYSLLTAYFYLTDENFEKKSEFPLWVKPDNGIYKVCGEAMEVNKIDLKEHDKIAITYTEAGKALYNWLDVMTNGGKNKLTVVGHNVAGDRNDIVQTLISRGTWDKFCSYRLRDTQTIACYLIDCGVIPNDVSGSLKSLVEYFKIESIDDAFHDAKYDTLQTVKVYQALVDLGKGLKRDADWSWRKEE